MVPRHLNFIVAANSTQSESAERHHRTVGQQQQNLTTAVFTLTANANHVLTNIMHVNSTITSHADNSIKKRNVSRKTLSKAATD